MRNVLPERAHAVLGASSAYRWMACPGSVELTRDLPDVETPAAREGTAAHHLAEMSLQEGLHPSSYLGDSFGGVRVSEDMVEAVSVFTDYVNRRMEVPSFRKLIIEQQVSLDAYDPPSPMFGTADAVLIFDGFIEVVDYKHGIGVFVEAENNPQTRYYGLGSLLKYMEGELPTLLDEEREPPSPIVLTIVQPRIPSTQGLVRSEILTPQELLDWADNVLMPAALRTLTDSGVFCAGDHCHFCKATPFCEELRKKSIEVAQTVYGPLPPPEILSPEDVAVILKQSNIISIWANSVAAHALRTSERDARLIPPGYRLVEKRAQRKWREGVEGDVIDLAVQLGLTPEEIAPPTLLTPAKAEKLIGFTPDEYVEKVSSGMKLVPEDSSAPDPIPAAQEVFKPL